MAVFHFGPAYYLAEKWLCVSMYIVIVVNVLCKKKKKKQTYIDNRKEETLTFYCKLN